MFEWDINASPVTPPDRPARTARSTERPPDSPRTQEWIRKHCDEWRRRYDVWMAAVRARHPTRLESASSSSTQVVQLSRNPELEQLDATARNSVQVGYVKPIASCTAEEVRCRPCTPAEWREFYRRTYYMGITQQQGFELRLVAKRAGVVWP